MFATLLLPAAPFAAPTARAHSVRANSADDLRQAFRLSRQRTVHVDDRALDRVLRVDAATQTIEAQAATRWSALAAAMAHHGHSAGVLAEADDSSWPTLGEALAAAAPGPDGQPLGRHLLSFTLVLPDGELRRVDRQGSRALFDLVLGGQGCVGVLYSATLSAPSILAACTHAVAPEVLAFPAAEGRPDRIELLLPPERRAPFLEDIRSLATDRRIALASIAVRRYDSGECGMLGWAHRPWAGIEVRSIMKPTLGAEVTRAEFRQALVGRAVALGGSFRLSDADDATREQLLAAYPRLPAFLAEKRRIDPGDKLQTRLSRALREKLFPR